MGIHVMKVNQRCRVYGHFLTEARKGKKEFILNHTSAESLQTICTQSVQLTQAMT